MEFKEYSDPEGRDYDITSSLEEESQKNRNEKKVDYSYLLADIIGILEDVTEEELMNEYGITMEEYSHPNKETLIKVKNTLLSKKHASR